MGSAVETTPSAGTGDSSSAATTTGARVSGLLRRATPTALTWFPYVVSALVTLAVALWTYRPWRFHGAMMATWGDPLAFHAWVQATIEDGWYEQATRLAAPFEMNSHTYTVTDELLFLVIGKVLAPLTGSAAGAVTLWVVITFPLAALFAVGAARYLGVGRLAALIPGIAFPLMPDHFLRALGHFSLSSVWAVSLGILLAVTLLRAPRLGRRGRIWFEAAMIVAALAISMTNAYYAVFAGLMVATAGVGGAIAQRSWRVLVSCAARGVALLGPIMVAVALDTRYAPRPAGYASFEITRSLADAEAYGGKITAMLLPSSLHRSGTLRALRTTYDTTFPNPAETPALGLVASVGFVGLVVWALVSYFRRTPELAEPRLRPLAAFTWVALFAYVVGGLGSAWALLLDGGGVRVWSRMHLMIGMVALLAVAVAADRLRGRLLRAVAVGMILVVVLVDQTSPLTRPDPVGAQVVKAELTAMTSEIADLAGGDAMIYQAPYVTFPLAQVPVEPASIYDGFLPYLYSTHTNLRWSYGGLQGDPAGDWQLQLTERPFADEAPMLAAAGFSGVLLDRSALVSVPDLADDVLDTLGAPALVSTSGRWEYYPLEVPEGAACTEDTLAEIADLAVEPPLLYPGDGMRTSPGEFTVRGGTGGLRIVTLRDGGWPEVRISFILNNGGTPVRVTFPDGTSRELDPGSHTVAWSGEVTETETSVMLEGGDATTAYAVGGLRATAEGSARVAGCLAQAGTG
jgi:phosphoglycerol transferase